MKRISAYLAFLLCLLGLGQCSKPTTEGSGETLVIIIGGLGAAQTADIVARLQNDPTLTVVSAAPWDGYKANVPDLYNQNKRQRLVLIGHSFGGETVVNACRSIAHVDCLILIDPVTESWGNMTVPNNAGTIAIFERSELIGPKTAKIDGVPSTIIEGSHNSIPHDAGLIASIAHMVNNVQE